MARMISAIAVRRGRSRAATLVAGSVAIALLLIGCTGKSGSSKADVPPLTAPGRGAATSTAPERKSWAGKQPAPEFPGGLTWFNVSQPPTFAALKGKVVLLDFWTLGCINCQHIIPDLKRLEEEFANELVVVGVHSGKYATEHDDESIRDAVRRYGLEHPVVNDPDFVVWNKFGANAWPTLVLVDPAGNLVGGHAGEGVYDLFQPIIKSLVAEFDAKGTISRVPFRVDLDRAVSSTVLSYPGKVLADEKGKRLFLADSGHNRILIASLDGALQRAIGSGDEGFADGAASEAEFRQPQGLSLSEDGQTLYVADTRNHAIRAVRLSDGEVRTIAGTGKQLDRLPADGSPAAKTALASPWDVLVAKNTLYITMAGVHQLWTIDLAKETISVFAGTSREGIADGNRKTMATLAQPSGLTTDGTSLYWVDPESSSVRRIPIDGNGEVKTIVGTGLFDYGDEDGPAASALLQHPQGIVFLNGTLFVGDTYNHKIRAVDPAKKLVSTAAGTGERGWADGPDMVAEFDEPGGLSAAGTNIYIADTNNQVIRVLDTKSGTVRTLTLSNLSAISNTPGRVLQVSLPEQVVAPGAGNLVLKVTTPPGHRLNSQAPSSLALSSSNLSVLAAGEKIVTWTSDEATTTITIPANYASGMTVLTATGQAYYCRKGEEALCFIQQVEVTLPVIVRDGGSGAVVLTLELPAGG